MGCGESIEPFQHTSQSDCSTQLLLAWQEQHNEEALGKLLRETHELIESVARRTLRDVGIVSAALLDDALSLVTDHLRRLPAGRGGGLLQREFDDAMDHRAVKPFSPRPEDGAAGRRFLVWLARRRAVDVARRHHRRCRLAGSFSECSPDRVRRAVANASLDRFARGEARHAHEDRLRWLRETIKQLPPEDRLIMDLTFEGKTLSVIAHVLGCCEGTVCRRRQRIENWLRENAPPAASPFGGGLRKHHRPPAVNEDPILKDHPDRPGEDELLDVPPRLGHPIG